MAEFAPGDAGPNGKYGYLHLYLYILADLNYGKVRKSYPFSAPSSLDEAPKGQCRGRPWLPRTNNNIHVGVHQMVPAGYWRMHPQTNLFRGTEVSEKLLGGTGSVRAVCLLVWGGGLKKSRPARLFTVIFVPKLG